MSIETEKVYHYLRNSYNTKQERNALFVTFCSCSEDNANKRALVSSTVKCVNFDRLTKWIFKNSLPQSADSMTFSNGYLYLIEFKAGDQVWHENKRKKLIESVSGKINDSDNTLFNTVFPKIVDLEEDRIKIRFYLVVDTKEMGISSTVLTLAALSSGPSTMNDPKTKVLLQQVLPDLKSDTDQPDHFDKIDIWYSELFDAHLRAHKIVDIDTLL